MSYIDGKDMLCFCGATLRWVPSENSARPGHWSACPMHKAAPKLLAALTALTSCWEERGTVYAAVMIQAGEAIAEAKP